jgi:thiaminase
MRVFDEAYNRVQNFFGDISNEVATPFCEFVRDFLKDFASLIFAIIIYGTLPIWVVPYKIAKKREKPTHKENKVYKEWTTPQDCNCRCSIHATFSNETLSPETKQAILDDFMKNSEQ